MNDEAVNALEVGMRAPDFTAPDQDGTIRTLSDFRGRPLVLYFYPKDMTPGCTTQACDFRDNMQRISARGSSLVGVSPDSTSRHHKFVDKESLTFPLLADEDHSIADTYGVWKRKCCMAEGSWGSNARRSLSMRTV